MTLHQNCRPFMAQIDNSSVNPKMANFSNGHSSDTGPVKKTKKTRYSRLHIVTYLCQFMGQNCEIWGVKKIGQRFSEAEPLDSKPRQTPPGCRTPPKIAPPYSLHTCPPTNPKTLMPYRSFIEKTLTFWRPLILAKVLERPWSRHKLTYVKMDFRGP